MIDLFRSPFLSALRRTFRPGTLLTGDDAPGLRPFPLTPTLAEAPAPEAVEPSKGLAERVPSVTVPLRPGGADHSAPRPIQPSPHSARQVDARNAFETVKSRQRALSNRVSLIRQGLVGQSELDDAFKAAATNDGTQQRIKRARQGFAEVNARRQALTGAIETQRRRSEIRKGLVESADTEYLGSKRQAAADAELSANQTIRARVAREISVVEAELGNSPEDLDRALKNIENNAINAAENARRSVTDTQRAIENIENELAEVKESLRRLVADGGPAVENNDPPPAIGSTLDRRYPLAMGRAFAKGSAIVDLGTIVAQKFHGAVEMAREKAERLGQLSGRRRLLEEKKTELQRGLSTLERSWRQRRMLSDETIKQVNRLWDRHRSVK